MIRVDRDFINPKFIGRMHYVYYGDRRYLKIYFLDGNFNEYNISIEEFNSKIKELDDNRTIHKRK